MSATFESRDMKKTAKKGTPPKAPAQVIKLPPIKLADDLPGLVWDQVPLKDLWIDAKGDRDATLEERDIRQLAESIAARGQLQPILVTTLGAPEGKLRVVAGKRRVRAMRDVLNLDVCDATTANFKTEADVLAARETENLQRQDLNPVEEATAVANLLEAVAVEAATVLSLLPTERKESAPWLLLLDPRVHAKAIELVAARLAKSATWVRDRAFLGRLDGKARDLVLSGDLPLASARIIAQISDPEVRDSMARRAAKDPHDQQGRPMSTEEVKHEASHYLYTLGSVPWKLEEPFAGKVACAGCEFNSANVPGLFEHGAKARESTRHARTVQSEPKAGICTNHTCWREKSAAANGAILRAAKKAEAVVLTVKGKPTPAVIAAAANEATPQFLKTSAVKERTTDRLDNGRTLKHVKTRAAPVVDTAATIRREAGWKHEEALRDWVDKKVNPAMQRWLAARPGSWPLFVLLKEHELFQKTRNQHGGKVIEGPAWRALVGLLKAPSWEGLLELEKGGKKSYGLFDGYYDGKFGTAASIAQLLELEVDGPPKLEQFLPKAAPGKPAPKAEGKPARTSGKKPKAKREPGEDDWHDGPLDPEEA